MSTITDLNDIANVFESKHGIDLLLKANLRAINQMLIKRGKGEELLETFKKVISDFENGK
jgi:hypothetical protein